MPDKAAAATDQETHSYKLPEHIVPTRYQIKLLPDLNNFTFEGHESIEIQVRESTKDIVLNSLELDLKAASIIEGQTILPGQITYDIPSERATITFPRQLAPGTYTLQLSFSGILNDKLHGFYRSRYADAQGNEKSLATTQFEATDARRAFPCFDEPEHKAVFDITLVIDDQLTAISNSSINEEKNLGNGKKEIVFNQTMKMSSYLVAFIIGELEGSDPVVADSTPIRIWARRGKVHLTNFARDCAAATLVFFSNYYGIRYPGDKLDLIAIPNFASGAMENLGAITFRETALLVDENSASHAELERVADVVAHEIAHMWFGDLVTMKWWNGLWLNEAFATFMEMLAVDNWKPEWKRWESFAAARAAAFAVDALHSTRAIEYPVRHPDEAGGMFDVLTYTKGASVLRMLEQYIGPEVFRKGINRYLEQHKYANAETTDLWDALEASSGQPVRKLMDSWIFQGGYPLVSVRLDTSGTRLDLKQRRFIYSSSGKTSDHLYHVPIMLRASMEHEAVRTKVILSEQGECVDFPSKMDWMVVNDGGHGFYRVAYSSKMLEALTPSIQDRMTPIERFNLVSDIWATTLSGQTGLQEYVELISLFVEEQDKNVWTAILGSLHYLNRVIDNIVRPQFERFVRRLLKANYARLGWAADAGESDLVGQLRGMVINALGTLGNDSEVQKAALEYYHRYKDDKAGVDAEIIPVVINTVATTGDVVLYEEFYDRFKHSATPQEEQRCLSALTRFRKRDLIDRTLKYALNGEVRTQDAPYVIQSVLMNVYCRVQGWEFLTKHWDELLELFPVNSISRMCGGVICLVDPDLEKQVIEFFGRHDVPHAGKTMEQHLETLRVAVQFKQREAENFGHVFA